MAINKVRKGQKNELLARKELEALGYLTEKKPRSRFSSPDFWGLFDLFCLKGQEVRLIQIKSNESHFYTARKEISEWKKSNKVLVSCEVWLFLKRTRGKNEWRIESL